MRDVVGENHWTKARQIQRQMAINRQKKKIHAMQQAVQRQQRRLSLQESAENVSDEGLDAAETMSALSKTASTKKAISNLNRNVEMCRLNKGKNVVRSGHVRFSHKDDVMGASVTANNADAKLSSLMHHPSGVDGEVGSNFTRQAAPSCEDQEKDGGDNVSAPRQELGKRSRIISSEPSTAEELLLKKRIMMAASQFLTSPNDRNME